MLSTFDLIAVLLILTTAFGWLNHVVIRLPHTIGILVMGLAASLLLIGIELAFPQVTLYESLTEQLRRIDFQTAVLDGMLAYLLFAGALHVDLSVLRRRAWAVGLMATAGVLISTCIVGFGLFLIADLLGMPIPLTWALVFGALISPTDPVAVLSTLKSVHVPETLEADMAGESLFNDGIGVVLFTVCSRLRQGEVTRADSARFGSRSFSSSRLWEELRSGSSLATSPIEPCAQSTTIRSRRSSRLRR